MYDGSALPLEENVKTTKQVVSMGHNADVFVEAEIGLMAKSEQNLNHDLLATIANSVQIQLVLHGGSGTPEDQVLKAISLGIRKINVNTEVSLAAVTEMATQLQAQPQIHLSNLMTAAQDIMTEQMYQII